MNNNKYTLGLDIGSTTSKAVVLDNKKNVIFFDIIDSGNDLKKSAEKLLQNALKKSCTVKFKSIISTGYGRHNVSFSNKKITEITAHGIGSKFLFPKVKTIIDVGGQDSKIIKLNKNGHVIDFIMNDKCSAGCGRFFESCAKKLKIPLSQFEKLPKKSQKNIKLSSTCTVFAESEIVSHLAKGEKKEDIIKSLMTNLINKIISLGSSLGFEDDIVFTGGVAKNKLLKTFFQKHLNKKIKSPKEPQLTAALGAALYGSNKFKA